MDATLEAVLGQSKGKNVLVIGDVMLDRYTYGEVSRMSPEAPVPILLKKKHSKTLGGAGNVVNNVVSLGGNATLLGVVGTDEHGKSIKMLLTERHIIDKLVSDPSRPTTVKNRIVDGDSQHLIRVDDESSEPVSPAVAKALIDASMKLIPECDVVVLSDYAKGVFTEATAQEFIAISKKYGKPVIADLKPVHKNLFVGVTLVTPNLKEAYEMTGAKEVSDALRALVEHFKSDVYVTRGSDGISVRTLDGGETHVPSLPVHALDISGAGDSVVAASALALASGSDIHTAAIIANVAGAIAVEKAGTNVVSHDELVAKLVQGTRP
jgi:D-beta-D-heptose 7-phosphate kinase / D-beta-D-heptose 1-phosphate adenosyltransferase